MHSLLHILLVDDEVELTEPLSRILRREGYQVDVAHDGAEGGRLAIEGEYDLLILDWMLPQQTGLEICQQLRSRGDQTPVLFLTAKDTLDDRVDGLDAGADDYLVKPFELRELLARVRALLRRPPTLEVREVAASRLCVGDLELDLENQLAYRQGRSIELSEKECQLLAYFMRYPNQLLTHEQIFSQVWGEGDRLNSERSNSERSNSERPGSNVLAAQVRLLRRKIEGEDETPLIHSVYGKGYRFGQ